MKTLLALILATTMLLSACATRSVATAIPKPGGTFKECRHCPEMVVIPAGSFIMGTPETESHHRDSERQHRVTIAKPFGVSKTEVTWDQWEACVRDNVCNGAAVDAALRLKLDGTPNPDFVDWGRGTRPVVGVSWYDAQAYVGWLNRKTGHDDLYRLLSEAEWEYAARGGTTTAYPWGDKLDHNYGNFGKEEPGLGPKSEGRDVWLDQTAPVASFPPNAFGLYDMHGNAFEWVEDCYLEDLSKTANDGSANKNGSCASREFRSGSFISNPYMHRSGNRVRGYAPDTRGRNYLTIRVGRTLVDGRK
ncbi:MAG: formylglycine-generating enzyme family protein [Gammaproteobacteria bacterium]